MATNQHQKILEIVRLIPPGRVSTYGAIANFLAVSPRTVGWALNRSYNPDAEKVPAHRVVNRKGMLSGKMHFGDPYIMEELLREEGIEVEEDFVQDFKKRLWDPVEEL